MTQIQKTIEAIRLAQIELANIQWTPGQVDHIELGEHLNALQEHLLNARGRASTIQTILEHPLPGMDWEAFAKFAE